MHSWSESSDVSPLEAGDQVMQCTRCGTVEEWATGSDRGYRLVIRRKRGRDKD